MRITPETYTVCRYNDGTFDLVKLYEIVFEGTNIEDVVSFYLHRIEQLQPIRSRQVAVVAITTALYLNGT